MFALSLNAPLAERLQYSPRSVTPDEIAAALAELDRLQAWLDDSGTVDTDSPLDEQIEALADKRIADDYPDAAEYKQFFEDCFNALGDHYPCPEVTSDYDCSVIFGAIRKGEDAREANEALADTLEACIASLDYAATTLEAPKDSTLRDALADARRALDTLRGEE
jgi:hypothetical protein